MVGPGSRDDLVLVRATFGLMLSDDGGSRFSFLCEDPWQFLDGFDPAVLLGAQGAMLVGLQNGLTRSRDGCAPSRDPDLDGMHVVDLAANPTARFVVAAAVLADRSGSRVARSRDGGERFEVLPGALSGVRLSTIEVASRDGATLYASGTSGDGGTGAFFRSDDAGSHWTRTGAPFSGEPFISGVDPTDPQVVYVRVPEGGDAGLGGTELLRSGDGGEHFTRITVTRGAMLGFAIRGDGRSVWIGGPADGLLRSDDGGAFRPVSDERVECLRWHADSLWMCGSFAPGAVMLWRARGDSALAPALRWSELGAPPARCAPGTPSRELCPARWQSVGSVIAPPTTDVGRDASLDAGGSSPPRGDCGCSTAPSARFSAWWLLALARRRQRGSPGAG